MREVFVIFMLACMATLCGCEVSSSNLGVQNVQLQESSFDLIVDTQTKIVYIDNEVYGEAHGHIYTPYYSANGYLCKYDDGVLIEIKNKDKQGILTV